MLQAIKELGEEKLQQEGRKPERIIEEALLTIVQDPNEGGNYPYVLVVVFRKVGNEFVYDRIHVEQTDKTKISRYLYRRGSSQGPDRTPTSRITEISKTFQGKLLAWLNKHGLDNAFFAALKEVVDRDKNRMLQDLQKEWQNVHSSLKRQQSSVLTIAIQDDGGFRYPGDFPEFRDALQKEIREKYGEVSQLDHYLFHLWREEGGGLW